MENATYKVISASEVTNDILAELEILKPNSYKVKRGSAFVIAWNETSTAIISIEVILETLGEPCCNNHYYEILVTDDTCIPTVEVYSTNDIQRTSLMKVISQIITDVI